MKGLLALVVLLGAACGASAPSPVASPDAPASGPAEAGTSPAPGPPGGGPWNLLLIETDDQRWDTLWAMPRLRRLLAEDGAVFTRALVSNPACCPSRTSLLSGGFYSHHTGVLQPGGLNGGQHFDDRDTLATRLQRAGYRTGLVGKYLLHLRAGSRRIPPGWSSFFVETTHRSYVNHLFLHGESTPHEHGRGEHRSYQRRYITDLEAEIALDFLDGVLAEEGRPPFFLWLATHAPHRPATPALQDRTAFPDFELGGRAYGEADLSDKPPYVRSQGRKFGDFEALNLSATLPHRQVRSLRAVDRAVEAILTRLEAAGELERTAVVFTSDNGFLWGEHRLFRKGMPYEESLRVPLVVRLPGIPAGERHQLVAMDLDIPATLLQLAGLPAVPGADGRSLVPLLLDPGARGRGALLSEGFRNGEGSSWCAVRTASHKWVEHDDGVRELYDLVADPFELESRHDDPDLAALRRDLSRRLEGFCGLSALTRELPSAIPGAPYAARLEARGGTPPYTWSLTEGNLPRGLHLAPDGRLSGTPTEGPATSPRGLRADRHARFVVEVRDRSRSPRDGRPQRFRIPYRISVEPSSTVNDAG